MPVLRKVRCKWASIFEPNTKYDPVYEIQALLDTKQAAELAALGFKLGDEKGTPTYRFKQKVEGTKKTGEKFLKAKPRLVDSEKKNLECLVGNGSLVNIQYEVESGSFAGNSYCKGALRAVQVLELVSFGEPADEFEDEGEMEVLSETAGSDVGDGKDNPF